MAVRALTVGEARVCVSRPHEAGAAQAKPRRNSLAMRSRKCNLRIRPTDPGVAILSDFESIVADRPTRRAERGGEFLGRNDCLHSSNYELHNED